MRSPQAGLSVMGPLAVMRSPQAGLSVMGSSAVMRSPQAGLVSLGCRYGRSAREAGFLGLQLLVRCCRMGPRFGKMNGVVLIGCLYFVFAKQEEGKEMDHVNIGSFSNHANQAARGEGGCAFGGLVNRFAQVRPLRS